MRRAYVRRPTERRALIERLVRDSEAAENRGAPFETYRDLLTFAACVGFTYERRLPYAKSEHTITWEQFANRLYFEGLIHLIGVAEKGDTAVLAEEQTEELVRIFEEYTNGGLEMIAEWLELAPGIREDEVLAMRILAQIDAETELTTDEQEIVEPKF